MQDLGVSEIEFHIHIFSLVFKNEFVVFGFATVTLHSISYFERVFTQSCKFVTGFKFSGSLLQILTSHNC